MQRNVRTLVNLIYLIKSFLTSIHLQKSASIHPRTSPVKLRKSFNFHNFSSLQKSTDRSPPDSNACSMSDRAVLAFPWCFLAPPRPPPNGRPRAAGFLAQFRQNVARFRLYRRRFLQENTRFASFFKIYQIIQLKILKFGKKSADLATLNNCKHLLNFEFSQNC